MQNSTTNGAFVYPSRSIAAVDYRVKMSLPREFVKKIYARVPLKRPIFELMRRSFHLPTNITQHLHFHGAFVVEIDRSHRFRLQHWGYMVENDLFWNGFAKGYEATSLEIWRRLAPNARVVLDVGANTGVYTLVARCLNPDAIVIAFEPVERVFRRLRRNLELNRYAVTCEQLAASDSSGTATMYDLPTEHLYSASLNQSMLESYNGVVEYSIPTKRIDDYLSGANITNVDLVKIDVEQFEPAVLRGMGKFLSHFKPTILLEVLNNQVAKEVNDIILDLGYSIFQVIEGRGLLRTSYIQATEHEERNYLLVQENSIQPSAIRDLLLQ
jgi:FkbM family methyltransferase